jgi:hypothetical protein
MNLLPKKLVFISVSAILYIAALILPAYNYSERTPNVLPGYECLTDGIFTLDFITHFSNPFLFISWLGNLPFFIGCIIFGLARKARGFKAASLVLFIALFIAMIMSFGSLIYYSHTKVFYSPNIGCFVWLFSILLMWSGAHLLKREFTEIIRN